MGSRSSVLHLLLKVMTRAIDKLFFSRKEQRFWVPGQV